jgi:hypothetical protein
MLIDAGVLVFLAGEFLGIVDVLFGAGTPGSAKGLSALATFLWGSVLLHSYVKVGAPINH